ncbi:SDR family oxidoreductase [Streptomyces sp. NPDC005811]|uniref:SDR family NAD(P)-dependent oxidoreductase n=1 Tax=Streptomyces sp. NPDC005811 TaxID=3154565 RepID=UPI0033DB6307
MTISRPEAKSLTDAFGLTGKRAIVTGASRGIGRAITLAFAAVGAQVCAVARSRSGLAETVSLAEGLEGSVTAVEGDLTSPDGIADTVEAAADALGGIDILVNNAGLDNEESLDRTSLEVWQQVFDLNVRSVFLVCKAAAPYLLEGGGKVINVASMFGQVGVRGEIAYVTSKHAVVGFTKALAMEWARKGIQVNSLGPGFVETDMLKAAASDEAVAAFMRRSTPMGRWAQPEEMTGAAVFLASSASDFMTGQLLLVDGGYTAQ